MTTRRKLAYLGVLCLLGVLLAEGGVRVMNRVRLGRWTVHDPASALANSRLYAPHVWLGQIPKPGTRVFAKGRRISINSLGYRGPEFPIEKPGGVLRLVCIGGSTTFDVKVSDDGKTWPARLEAVLHDRYGLNQVQVVNAATNGYALPRTIIDLSLRTLDIQPDWIICYPGVNDLSYANRTEHQVGRSHEAIVRPPPGPSSWLGLLCRSELYNEIVARIRYHRQMKYGNWEGEAIERFDAPDPRGMAALRRNLATLAGICRAHDIPLALVTVRKAYTRSQPPDEQMRLARTDLMDHPHLSLAGHYAGYETVNRLIREAADRFGLLLIDPEAGMPADASHFDDSVHFNDIGAAAFAEFAAGRIAPVLTSRLAAAKRQALP